jgi:hypothetical protein
MFACVVGPILTRRYPHHRDIIAEPAMSLGPSLGLVDERVDECRSGQRR